MKQRRTHRECHFGPLQEKTLANILCHLFVSEFGYGNKVRFAEAMIERLLETIDGFIKPQALLKPGQMLWMAAIHDGRKHTFKSMKETPQVPVILELVADEDLQALANGAPYPDIRRRRHARLLDQAMAQGGVLAQTDLAALTLSSESVVRKDIIQVQQDEERRLPHRGSVQDIGPTLSHKVEVARLLEAGYLEPEICRKLHPVHDLRSVERYAQTYKNMLKLVEHGFAPNEISSILSLSKRLVQEYISLVKEHHPQIVSGNPHLRGLEASASAHIPEGH
jgi:hypothetical protein